MYLLTMQVSWEVEARILDAASQNWLEVLNVNTIAPLILTQNFTKLLNGNDKKLIYVSSKNGFN